MGSNFGNSQKWIPRKLKSLNPISCGSRSQDAGQHSPCRPNFFGVSFCLKPLYFYFLSIYNRFTQKKQKSNTKCRLFWPFVADSWKFSKIQKTIDAYKITTNGPNDFKFGMVVLCMDIKLFVKKKFKKSFYFRISFFKVGSISENENLALLAPITS